VTERSGGSQITSLKNPVVQLARRLNRPAERAERDRFLIEGPASVQAAVDAGVPVDTLLATGQAARRHAGLLADAARGGAQVLEVTDRVMASIAPTVTPQGVIAIAPGLTRPIDALAADARLVCVLDRVADPGNLGTVLRAADAAGADALVTTAGSVHADSPKAVRAAAGSLFHVPVFDAVPWPRVHDACRERGLRLVGADAHAGVGPDDAGLDGPVALVLGSEAHGLADEVRADCDELVHLPVHGRAESLNLAAAAAILLYEIARRHHGLARGEDR
jgi:TrmH family RNA methyltransferase